MRPTVASEDRIIATLYEAASGLGSWRDAMDALHSAMKADAVQLATFDKVDGSMSWSENSAGSTSQAAVVVIVDHARMLQSIDVEKAAFVARNHNDGHAGPARDRLHLREHRTLRRVGSILATKVSADDEQGAILAPMYELGEKASDDGDLACLQRLAAAGVEPTVGSVGDSGDNAMAGSIIGLYNAPLIEQLVPWRNLNAPHTILAWVHWFNHQRLFEPIGHKTPAEFEAAYHRALAITA